MLSRGEERFLHSQAKKKKDQKSDARPEFLVYFVYPVAFLTFLQA